MAFKFVVLVLFAFIAVARASLLPAQAKTIAQPVLAKAEDEYDPHPQYKFAYDVEDVISGDSKRQVEARDGDVVQGEYALNDADGFRRTVQYSADPVNGFNAIVHREPLVKGAVVEADSVKASSATYVAPAATVVKTPTLAYAAAPALLKSVPVAYAGAPAVSFAHH